MRIIEICFTGFDSSERKTLIDMADSNGFLVRKEVTKNLHILCIGDNAGPKKLEAANKDGVIIITKPEFVAYVNSGIPETVIDSIEKLRALRNI